MGIFSKRQIDDIFLIFPSKQDLTFHANCLLRRQFAWNVKSCFLGKIRKNISKCHLLKILPRVLSVNIGNQHLKCVIWFFFSCRCRLWNWLWATSLCFIFRLWHSICLEGGGGGGRGGGGGGGGKFFKRTIQHYFTQKSRTEWQTVKIRLRWLIISHLIRIYRFCKDVAVSLEY